MVSKTFFAIASTDPYIYSIKIIKYGHFIKETFSYNSSHKKVCFEQFALSVCFMGCFATVC